MMMAMTMATTTHDDNDKDDNNDERFDLWLAAIVAIVIFLCTVHSITVGLAEDSFLLSKSVARGGLNHFFLTKSNVPSLQIKQKLPQRK